MDFEQKSRQISVMQSGACVLRARVSYVQAKGEGQERFNDCYRKAAEAYLAWAEHKQASYCKRNTLPKKRTECSDFAP